MSRRPALLTQADVARALRAAKQAGAAAVEVRPDGTMIIRLANAPGERVEPRLDCTPEIVL